MQEECATHKIFHKLRERKFQDCNRTMFCITPKVQATPQQNSVVTAELQTKEREP